RQAAGRRRSSAAAWSCPRRSPPPAREPRRRARTTPPRNTPGKARGKPAGGHGHPHAEQRLEVAVEHVEAGHLEDPVRRRAGHSTPPPRNAARTSSLASTSAGRPPPSTLPSASHTSRVETAVSTLITCSTHTIVVPPAFTERMVSI